MKTPLPHIIQRTAALFVAAVIVGFTAAHEAQGATLYTYTTNTNTWATATRWSSSTNGPFTDAWVNNSDVTFLSGNNYYFSGMGAASNVGNVTVESNATVTFTTNGSTFGTGGNVRIFTVNTNAVLDFSSQDFSTAAGTGFVKEGSGVLAMGGGSYQGGFTLNGGTMVLRGVNAMGAGATNVLTLSNGIIAANATRTIAAGKYGGGIFIAGNIQFGALSTNYATNAQYLISDSANISFADGVSLAGAMRTLTIGGKGTYTFGGVISNGGLTVGLASGATGRIALSGANTYSGGTVISSGTLQLGTDTASGSVVGNITNNGTLAIYRSDDTPLTNLISGSGSLVKLGTNSLALLTDNTYTGSTTISNGILSLGNSGTSGTIAGTGIDIKAGGSLVINRSDNVTLAQVITNAVSGSLVQLGSGTTTLTGVSGSIFKGGILVSNGTLQLGDGTQSYSLSDGNITNNSILIWNRSGNGNVSNTISGTGTFIKMGSGNLYLLKDNSYTGDTVINSGLLSLGNGGTTGSVDGAINITNSGASLRINRTDTLLLSHKIGGAGSLDQFGSGTTTLSGDNTFAGATKVTAGTLALNSSSGSALGGTASVTVSSNATLLISKSNQVNNAAAITLSGGTIERTSGVSEVFGDLNLTTGSFLDYGTGASGTLTFGTYTPSSLLTVNNFFAGNKLVFSSNIGSDINNTNLFKFNNGFSTNWNGSTFTITAIPEPSTYAAAAALIGLMLLRRRSGRNKAVK